MFRNVKKIYVTLGVIFALAVCAIPMSNAAPKTAVPVKQTQTKTAPSMASHTMVAQPERVSPNELVAKPNQYLNKRIVMDAKFDKFSTLGLDYKKAFKDSQKYIGFLVQRDDVKDHNVPLSELKLFVLREYAEKFVDLSTGDKISLTGKVFSTALGDPWVEIQTIQVIQKMPAAKE